MLRSFGLVAALLSLGLAPASAQTPGDGSRFLGTWEGPYAAEGAPPGSLRLVIARENNAWKVTHDIFSDNPPASGEVRNFETEGNTLRFLQTIGDLDCRFTATLEAGQLKGSGVCTEGGAPAVTGTFALTRRSGTTRHDRSDP
jgi:hypothetical protein